MAKSNQTPRLSKLAQSFLSLPLESSGYVSAWKTTSITDNGNSTLRKQRAFYFFLCCLLTPFFSRFEFSGHETASVQWLSYSPPISSYCFVCSSQEIELSIDTHFNNILLAFRSSEKNIYVYWNSYHNFMFVAEYIKIDNNNDNNINIAANNNNNIKWIYKYTHLILYNHSHSCLYIKLHLCPFCASVLLKTKEDLNIIRLIM